MAWAEAYHHAEFYLDPSNLWPQYTNVTDRTDRTDRLTGQRSDSVGRNVLQTVAQKSVSYGKVSGKSRPYSFSDTVKELSYRRQIMRQRQRSSAVQNCTRENTMSVCNLVSRHSVSHINADKRSLVNTSRSSLPGRSIPKDLPSELGWVSTKISLWNQNVVL